MVRADAAAKVVAAAKADAEACDNSGAAHDDIRDDSTCDDNMCYNACNGVHDNTHDNDREPADDAWAVVEARTG